jgi:hypothetical protein
MIKRENPDIFRGRPLEESKENILQRVKEFYTQNHSQVSGSELIISVVPFALPAI